MSSKQCFLPGTIRECTISCVAYSDEGKACCKLLNLIDKLVPTPTRPVAPTPPPKSRLA